MRSNILKLQYGMMMWIGYGGYGGWYGDVNWNGYGVYGMDMVMWIGFSVLTEV